METKKNKTFKRILVVVFIIVVAFVAGISGEIFTRAYLSNFDFLRDFYFTGTNNLGQGDLIISQPKKVVVEQDVRLKQLVSEIQPSVLGIYNKKRISANFSDNLYLASDMTGQSFVLTSDGWLISSAKAITGSKDNYMVYYNNKSYEIDTLIKDDATETLFLKINAQNLPVIKLADRQAVFNGRQIFIFNSYYQQINLANIVDKSYRQIREKNDLIISSQDLDKLILSDDIFPANLAGSPIFNLEGEIIGLYRQAGADYGQITPINYVDTVINQVLKNEDLTRPYLGIKYIDLNKTVSFDNNLDQNIPKQGVYVQAVLADSPLFNKVVKGDIILSLENQDLDVNNDLVDLLMSYKSGQEIRLKFKHLDKEQEINVILK